LIKNCIIFKNRKALFIFYKVKLKVASLGSFLFDGGGVAAPPLSSF
jgi:hypothetical protein